jgi:hypothetical protein
MAMRRGRALMRRGLLRSGQQGLGTQARDAPRRARILAVDGRECRCLRAAAAATVAVRIGRELCQKPKSSPVRRKSQIIP